MGRGVGVSAFVDSHCGFFTQVYSNNLLFYLQTMILHWIPAARMAKLKMQLCLMVCVRLSIDLSLYHFYTCAHTHFSSMQFGWKMKVLRSRGKSQEWWGFWGTRLAECISVLLQIVTAQQMIPRISIWVGFTSLHSCLWYQMTIKATAGCQLDTQSFLCHPHLYLSPMVQTMASTALAPDPSGFSTKPRMWAKPMNKMVKQ